MWEWKELEVNDVSTGGSMAWLVSSSTNEASKVSTPHWLVLFYRVIINYDLHNAVKAVKATASLCGGSVDKDIDDDKVFAIL